MNTLSRAAATCLAIMVAGFFLHTALHTAHTIANTGAELTALAAPPVPHHAAPTQWVSVDGTARPVQ